MGFDFGDIGNFFEDTFQHWDSWLPQVAGGALTMLGMPYIGVPLAGIGAGVHNYQDTGNYLNAGMAGLGGAATAYGGANLLSGANAGWNAAAQNGGNLIDKAWAAGQGGLFGTYGSGDAAQSLLGANGGGTGLFGQGTMFSPSGLRNTQLASTALNMAGSAAAPMLAGDQQYPSLVPQPPQAPGFGSYDYQPYYVPGSTDFTYGQSGTNYLYGAPSNTTAGVDAQKLLEDYYQTAKREATTSWQYPSAWGTG